MFFAVAIIFIGFFIVIPGTAVLVFAAGSIGSVFTKGFFRWFFLSFLFFPPLSVIGYYEFKLFQGRSISRSGDLIVEQQARFKPGETAHFYMEYDHNVCVELCQYFLFNLQAKNVLVTTQTFNWKTGEKLSDETFRYEFIVADRCQDVPNEAFPDNLDNLDNWIHKWRYDGFCIVRNHISVLQKEPVVDWVIKLDRTSDRGGYPRGWLVRAVQVDRVSDGEIKPVSLVQQGYAKDLGHMFEWISNFYPTLMPIPKIYHKHRLGSHRSITYSNHEVVHALFGNEKTAYLNARIKFEDLKNDIERKIVLNRLLTHESEKQRINGVRILTYFDELGPAEFELLSSAVLARSSYVPAILKKHPEAQDDIPLVVN